LARSNENYLRWQFGRWVGRGWTPNVTLIATDADPMVVLDPGEVAIAHVALDNDAEPLLITDRRLIREGKTLVRFGDVVGCIWIDKNTVTRLTLDKKKFDQMILELHDGNEVVIKGLGQAVFPLMSFFHQKLLREHGRLELR